MWEKEICFIIFVRNSNKSGKLVFNTFGYMVISYKKTQTKPKQIKKLKNYILRALSEKVLIKLHFKR